MKYNLMRHTIIAGLILLVYLVSSFNPFTGVSVFIIPSLSYIALTLITLMFCFKNNISLTFRENLVLNAPVIAVMQITLLYIAAFFTSLGISPYNLTLTGVLINIIYFSTVLLGKETSRTYLIKSCPKKEISMGMALIALLYTFISTPLAKFTTLKAPIETVKFFGSDFLPTFAQNILATYLALLSGPAASLAYLGILEAFEWLSPILPNPPWAIKALITTLIPTIGFLMTTQTVSPFTLMRYGIISRAEAKHRPRIAKKLSPSLSWTAIAIIALILIWGSTGLLGFQPSIIASGSMRPTLDVGDIAITAPTPPEKIKVGDIIQYWREGEPAPTIHRVIEISRAGGTTYIITKGDANTAPDEPIMATRKLGKVILVIPKLGWVSIYLKEAAATAWDFLTNNPAAAYTILGITLITSAYKIHTYRNQPLRKLRRRLKR